MKMPRTDRSFALIMSMVALGAWAFSSAAQAVTVGFDWEDGISTVLGQFISGTTAQLTASNVASGGDVDYGAGPVPDPVPYVVTPFQGSRMLELAIDPVDETNSNAVRPYLAYVEHLNHGDKIQFSFQAYDPAEGRSPSVLADGAYAQNGDIDSFAGFFTPFQEFDPGTGWLLVEAHADGNPSDPVIPFDEGTMGDREAVVLRVRPFRPTFATLASGGTGTYNFYVDDMRLSVISSNPLAQITLPDGSVTLVNILGDMDCDGDTDFDDIDDFVLGLNNPALYLSTFGVPPTAKGDTDVDGDQDFDDIPGFVSILSGGEAQGVPEPSTFILLIVSGLAAIWRLRPRS